MASATMNTGQSFTVTIQPDDATGDLAEIDGPPTWASDTPGIVNLSPATDGLSCIVTGLAPGACNITPSGVSYGVAFAGPPIAVTVNAAPLPQATTFAETIGYVGP